MLRFELREILSPRAYLRKPSRWLPEDGSDTDQPTHLRDLVAWELSLAADNVQSALRDRTDTPWMLALPHLLEEFQGLLRDALDLSRYLGGADDFNDHSHRDLPSIVPHRQNRGYRDWVILIELLRDAWLALQADDAARAAKIARSWFDLPYPTFKRLALFAASHDDCISFEQWVDWLLVDNAWWLWSSDTGREVFRLFVLQGKQLRGASQESLEDAILAGPPREMYPDDIESQSWQGLVDREVWLRLVRLISSGLQLGDEATTRLAELYGANPEWDSVIDERDEFSHWMSGTGDPDFEDFRDVETAPGTRSALVDWLRKPLPQGSRPFYEDTWRDVCRTSFSDSLSALSDLAQEGDWPIGRWREALQTWSEAEMVERSWREVAPLLQTMPEAILKKLAHSVAWWLEKASSVMGKHEDAFLKLCGRVLNLSLEASTGITSNGVPIDKPVTEAINHPVGRVTQALVNLWFQREPNDNDGLPSDIEPLFTRICDSEEARFRHGRVLLGAHVIALFRVDRRWTEQHLLPLFSWTADSREARGVWEGFLWSPRLYPPLLKVFKTSFLDIANHYLELGEHREQYAAFLTYVALERIDGYTADEFGTAIGSLPLDGLEQCARTLAQVLEGAAEQRGEYWKNRVQPFWRDIWPKHNDRITPGISESLARLAIAAGSEFPEALNTVHNWIRPLKDLFYVLDLLSDSELCNRFPVDTLKFLSYIVKDQPRIPKDLAQCLDEIEQASPKLVDDPQFKQLQEHIRRQG